MNFARKNKGIKKGIVKPINFSEFNIHCQINLINFQSQSDRAYKFIMVYQDQLTKFVILKSLGALSILQFDNGRDFGNNVVTSLKEFWLALKIVHGKPPHLQSQDSVEKANQDIENMHCTLMKDNEFNHWSEGLHFI